MFWEIAQIEVKPGEEAAFEAGVEQAVPLFQRAKGCHGVQLHRSVEIPTRYRLLVQWQTVEDHTVHFPRLPRLPAMAPPRRISFRESSCGRAHSGTAPGLSIMKPPDHPVLLTVT